MSFLPVQACYGHTEGTAGITGALLAITALRQSAAAPIVNLRSVNPYVTAALSDWRSLKGLDAHAPRQLAPGPLLRVCCILNPHIRSITMAAAPFVADSKEQYRYPVLGMALQPSIFVTATCIVYVVHFKGWESLNGMHILFETKVIMSWAYMPEE